MHHFPLRMVLEPEIGTNPRSTSYDLGDFEDKVEAVLGSLPPRYVGKIR